MPVLPGLDAVFVQIEHATMSRLMQKSEDKAETVAAGGKVLADCRFQREKMQLASSCGPVWRTARLDAQPDRLVYPHRAGTGGA
jgi:hypothetical protein